jgi:peptidylprolyl isomerase
VKSKSTVKKWLILLLLLGIGLVACGPAQDPQDEVATVTARAENAGVEEESEAETPAAELAEADTPEVEEPEAVESQTDAESDEPLASFDILGGASEDDVQSTSSGLQYIIFSEGDGELPQEGEVVSVHYTGWLEDGTEFDSSRSRGTPFQFAVGRGMVIPGWDEGVALLPIGTEARLIIPPDLAYGAQGRPGIPPDSTLVFDVELLSVQPGSPESPTAVEEDDYTVTDSGLKYYDIEVGDGPPLEEGQEILMHYTGWLEDGTKFDSSIDRGQPIPLVVSAGQIIPGWDEGIESMNMGGIRQLVIPPDLAFGEEGAGGGIIPPNATLILEVEVIDPNI